MKIHQIAPPFIPVGHNIKYGGIERVVYHLDRALTRLGHETSVSAPKESNTVGKLYETIAPINLEFEGNAHHSDDSYYIRYEHMSKVISIANQNDFDIVQCHDENLLSFFKLINKPTFYTMHSVPEEFWKSYLHPDLISEDLNLVAVSNRQKEIFTQEGWKIKYVVHNGFDVDVNNFSDKYDYFFSLGILAPRKGHHLAIKVAKKLNKDLLIAGNMDDRQYFEEQLKPHITHDLEKDNDKLLAYKNLGNGKGRIIYVGKVNDEQKMPLYAHANAFFALSTFEDPLPGVVIETMACGTPVIGSKKGGIPEMIVDGKTGYIVDIEKIDEITDATRDIGNINPVECRKRYEQNFTSKRMAEEYLKLYNLVM